MVVCRSALKRDLPKGGKWSFRTLKGWVRGGGRWVHVHVMVNTTSNYCMYMYIRFIDMLCGLSIGTIAWVVCRHTSAPASPRGGKWSFRTLRGLVRQGWGQIRFIKYKYKYKYSFFRVSNTNTNTNTPTKIWSNTNTNTNTCTAHQIQIQIQIHTEAETKLTPFYRWHTQIHSVVRTFFYLFKFQW